MANLTDSFCHTIFPDAPDISFQDEYPDDFEEAEEEEDYEDEVAFADNVAPLQSYNDVLEEFQLCDAGGLTITLKALKEKG